MTDKTMTVGEVIKMLQGLPKDKIILLPTLSGLYMPLKSYFKDRVYRDDDSKYFPAYYPNNSGKIEAIILTW